MTGRVNLFVWLSIFALPLVLGAQTTYTYLGGSGDWDDPTKWDPNGVPGTGDVAVINDGVVYVNSDITVQDLTFNDGELNGSGTITVTGTMTWQAGLLTADVVVQSTLSITGDQYRRLNSHTLTNQGSASWEGNGDFRFSYNATFINQSGATFTISTDADLDLYAGSASFENYGTVQKENSDGTTYIGFIFNNYGTVQVQSGTLRFLGSGTSTGLFSAASEALLDFAGSGAQRNLQASSTINASQVIFSGGQTNIYGTYSVSDTTHIQGGILNFEKDLPLTNVVMTDGALGDSGAVTISGKFQWSGGKVAGPGILYLNGNTEIFGDDFKEIKAKTVNNMASCRWSGGGSLRLLDGALFYNLAGANFTIENDALLDLYSGLVRFKNWGTITKSNSVGTTVIETPFDNQGTFNITNGNVRLTGSGNDSAAVYVIAEGCSLFTRGSYRTMKQVTVQGAGVWQMEDGSVTVEDGGLRTESGLTFLHSDGTLEANAPVDFFGPVIWEGGEISGSDSVFVQNQLQIHGENLKSLSGAVLVNKGQTAWEGSGDLRLMYNAVIDNKSRASFEIKNDALLDRYSGSATINNYGSLRKTGQTGTTVIEAVFNNYGLIEILSGTLRFTNTLVNFTDGRIQGNATLDVISANVTNHGTISPGPESARLTVLGDYHQEDDATLEIEIGGRTSGDLHDQLEVTQKAWLNGRLQIALINDFVPVLGDSFVIMLYESIGGTFKQLIGAEIGDNLQFIPRYYDNLLALIVQKVTNHPPIAINDSVTIDEDQSTTLFVLFNDYDPDGDSISVVALNSSQHGKARLTTGEDIQYTPDKDFFGSDSFRYTISDGKGGIDSAWVIITINPFNDPPDIFALPDTVNFAADSSLLINIWDAVEDPETPDAQLSYTFFKDNDSLLMAFNSTTGWLTLSANPAFAGLVKLVLEVADPQGAYDRDSMLVHVEPYTALTDAVKLLPKNLVLEQNFPNPFNATTNIRFALPEKQRIKIEIFNVQGQKVCTLADQVFTAGFHSIKWDGRNWEGKSLPSGLYLYRLHTRDRVLICKLLLVR